MLIQQLTDYLSLRTTFSLILYSSKYFNGLGLIEASWEAPIQHNVLALKSKVNDPYITKFKNLENEVHNYLYMLKLDIIPNI